VIEVASIFFRTPSVFSSAFSANNRTSRALMPRVISKQNAAQIVSLDSQRQQGQLPVLRKLVFA
jgi:hypothetical protein